jgi:RimJ/RimL family protein N-acetyltransferase
LGEFVNLRPLIVADASLTLTWRQSPRAKFLSLGAGTLEEQEAWIGERPASEYNFIIELKNGLPIGMLSVTGIHPLNRHAEPGRFLIGEEEAVRGIPAAIEAMKLLYGFIFNELDMIRVWGTVAADNSRMVTWQKYLGMKEEGRLRRHYFINGHFQDAVLLGLLIEEYRAVSLPRMNALIAAARPPTAKYELEKKSDAG